MLVNFETKNHATITMFEEVARKLLEMMGQSGAIPGAIRPGDIDGALKRLNTAFEAHTEADLATPEPDNDVDDYDEEPVSLKNRAVPLIQLLQAAQQQDTSVTWQSQNQSV